MAVYNPTPPPVPRRGGTAPQPQLRLTHAERDQVADLLRDAYAEGQLDEDEFDERVSQAMTAKVRGDLEPLVADLSTATGQPAPGATAPARGPEAPPDSEERGWAMGAHVSGYFTLALGPLLILLTKGNTSPYVRRQAFQALNHQLNFLIASLLIPLVFWLIVPIFVYVFMVLGWIFLPAIAGLATALGANWRYPFVIPIVKDRRTK